MTLEVLRDQFRFRMKSRGVFSQPAPDLLDAWINRGMERLAIDTMCLEDVTTLVPDGTNSSFQVFGLSTVVATGIQTLTAIGIRGIDHADGLLELVDIRDIRDAEVNDILTTGTPEQYAIYGSKVYFDAIPGATLTHNIQYYKSATVLTLDADEPELPLRQHSGLILTAALLEFAIDTMDGNTQAVCRAALDADLPSLSRRINQRGKNALRRGTRPHRL
jgi:hypothetical protein